MWALKDLFYKNPEWNQYLTDLKNFILSTQSEEQVKSEELVAAFTGRECLDQWKSSMWALVDLSIKTLNGINILLI
jgi:hypothetical protein